MAAAYAEAGADELFVAGRATRTDELVALAARVARAGTMPVAMGAELSTLEDVGRLLEAGVARVFVGGQALRDPDFVRALARTFGSASVGVAIDAEREGDHWRVRGCPDGEATEWEAVTWARVMETQGCGELVVSSPAWPAGEAFDLELLGAVAAAVSIPVLAAGEARCAEDVFDALMIGDADGVVVGSLLHSGRCSIRSIKQYLAERGLPVRLD